MTVASEKLKLEDYMLANSMTKEEVFQAIARKEISGSFVAGGWLILDERGTVSATEPATPVVTEIDSRTKARLAREKESVLAKIAMAQTMAKTAQKEAQKSTKSKAKVKPKSATIDEPERSAEIIPPTPREVPAPTPDRPLGGGKLDFRKSDMAESILAEAREIALGPQAMVTQSKTTPPPLSPGSLAAGILAEARDLAKLQGDISNIGKTLPPSPIDDNVPPITGVPKFIARQFDEELSDDEDGEEEERWKTKLDAYLVEKGITMEDAFKLITSKQVNGQFIGGSWYIIDSDDEHRQRKRGAAATAAVAEQQTRAEDARREQVRRDESRRKIKIGEYMMDNGLTKEQAFKLIQDKTISGHFTNGDWYILESEEDFLARERTLELETEALVKIEKAKEEAYKERRHEANLQDGLNEEQRAQALNMPFITDAKFADRTILKTIGVVQGSTVRAKSLPAEMSGENATLPGAELVSFTSDIADARAQAIDRMKIDAYTRGANAVVSTQFSTSMIDLGVIEILVYGTAVVVASAAM
ncbi:MAG: heavy metal-binding domain-containing protein [Porticoccaceae bacterium]|nr:heavy metal-binding domain-containing protein [Porticoccaceae bacterium]